MQQAQNKETWSTEMLLGTPRFQANSPPGAGRGGVIQRDLSNSCHFLPGLSVPSLVAHPPLEEPIQCCVCVYVCVYAQRCLTLCDPMDCSLPGSSVHGILQARLLE